jgi:hypothetical protein
MINLKQDRVAEAINQTDSMAAAAALIKVHFTTFKRYAILYGLYETNQGGKGITKQHPSRGFEIEDVLDGKHPQYNTFKLKNRLLKLGRIKNECSICDVSSWMNSTLTCELDHIDGNKYNHAFKNLRMLCPNCHSQTKTYRNKKRK